MITVIINSYNNEDHIADCIASARLLTQHIVVVDMQSQDETAEIARRLGAHVHTFPASRYVEPARMFGISQATTEWVFILDTDERITAKLAAEINDLFAKGSKIHASHFRIPRQNMFAKNTWLKHGGWWPDHQIRLINRKFLLDWPARIHSTPEITGSSSTLRSPLVHYFHTDISGMVKKTIIFEDIESDLLYKAGRKVTISTFFRKYLAELSRRLIIKQGFRDGVYGWLESIYQGYSKTITWIYVYEKKYITNPSLSK
ncbi:MAG: glycosyltransferase family 2 protein [Candidatus Roizmanbacteria bacterium]